MEITPKIMKTITKFLPLYASRRHFLISASLFCGSLLTGQFAHADINSVTALPGVLTTPLANSYTANITWRVNRTETDAAGAGPFTRPVSSSNAILFINGSNAGVVGNNLSRNSTLLFGASETVSLAETISFNAAQLKQIATSPPGSVRIVRTFNDTQTTSNTQLQVFAGSNNVEDVIVRRIELNFQNRSTTDVVTIDEPIRAIADVAFSSSGVIQGEWRLIDPTTSLGSQAGRVLQVVRHNVVSSGQGRTQIISPKLPTSMSGLYLLAFAIQQEDNQIDIPILRYFVVDSGIETSVIQMKTFSPEENSELNLNTVFSWAAVNTAKAYQVEIFSESDTQPLTGKLVTHRDLKLKLSSMSLDWLEPSTQYFWQVRALGEKGETLAVSSKQLIASP